jgi:hypothetical protein
MRETQMTKVSLSITDEDGFTVFIFHVSGTHFMRMKPTTAAEIVCLSHGLDWEKVTQMASFNIHKHPPEMTIRIEIEREKSFDILATYTKED